jgi:hypothetical protein
LLSADLGFVDFTATLTDGDGTMETSSDGAAAGGIVSIPFSNYTSVNLADITEIKVTFDPAAEFDITLDDISITVPEPGALLLLSAALIGLAMCRRSS